MTRGEANFSNHVLRRLLFLPEVVFYVRLVVEVDIHGLGVKAKLGRRLDRKRATLKSWRIRFSDRGVGTGFSSLNLSCLLGGIACVSGA